MRIHRWHLPALRAGKVWRIGLGLAGVGAVAVLFLVLRPNGEAEPPLARHEIRITIPDGGPTEVSRRVDIEEGEFVVLIVRSAAAGTVHVHGYDLQDDVGPSQPARIAFPATIPGRFEVELHDGHAPFAELHVHP
jgi:hypothetical protein